MPVEFLTWSVNVSTAPVEAVPALPARSSAAAAPNGTRGIFDPLAGREETVPVYLRRDLAGGMQIDGPALVAEPQTTTLVPGGWRACVTAAGHLLLERQP